MKGFKAESDPRSLYGPGQSALRRPRLAIMKKFKVAKPAPLKGLTGLTKLKGLMGK